MTLNVPRHIAKLLGKRVRVTNSVISSSWEGILIAYAADPSIVIDTDYAGRVCLPASFGIEGVPEVPDPAVARDEFLTASVAVWREIDRLDAEPAGYHPVRMSVDLRRAERAAWERYRDLLPPETT